MRLLFILFICLTAGAQTYQDQSLNLEVTIPPVAILSVEPSNESIVFELDNNEIAGTNYSFVYVNNIKWLNFTSCLPIGKQSRTISAQIDNGMLPQGLELNLQISDYQGSGEGDLGTSAGKVTLTSQPQILVSNIKNGYTGSGKNNGYQLIYELKIVDYDLLAYVNESILTVSYTITDD